MIDEKLSSKNIYIFLNKSIDVSETDDFINLDMTIHIKNIKNKYNKPVKRNDVHIRIDNCLDISPSIYKYIVNDEIHIDVKCKVNVFNNTTYSPFNTIIQEIAIVFVFNKDIINKVINENLEIEEKNVKMYFSKYNMRHMIDFQKNQNSNNIVLHLIRKQNINLLYQYEVFIKYFIIPAIFTGFTILVSNFSNVEYIGMFATFVLSDIALLFTLEEKGDTTVAEINIAFNILTKIVSGFIRLWVQKNDIDYVEGTYNVLLDFFNLVTKKMVILSGNSENFIYSSNLVKKWDTFSNIFFIDKTDFTSVENRELSVTRIEIDDINDSLEGIDISNSGNTRKLTFDVLLIISILTVFLYTTVIVSISKFNADKDVKTIYDFINKNNIEINNKEREIFYPNLYLKNKIYEYYNFNKIQEYTKEDLREIDKQSSCVNISF